MGKVTAYTDSKGNIHRTPEQAAKSDLAAMLGGENNIAMANVLFENRERLEKIFAEYDFCMAPEVLSLAQ